MDNEFDNPTTLTKRHKCSACFKQYKKKEHLIEHMKVSYHSIHQPKCGVCQKRCKSFESLREHLTGPLPKENCSKIFSTQGCVLCLVVFDSQNSLSKHKETCPLSAPSPLGTITMHSTEPHIDFSELMNGNGICAEAIAMDCEMVGGGSDGTLNLCARVCLIDEYENLIFHTYVQPQMPVTNYRYEITGITEVHLRDAMALEEVQQRIQEILFNGESIERLRLDGGKAKLLVGHGLKNDLNCLKMNYPDHLLRDTAKYSPLMKTNLVCHSLKYLTRTYLGLLSLSLSLSLTKFQVLNYLWFHGDLAYRYDIQSGVHDTYEDCVSAMRLYKRMRALDHQVEGSGESGNGCHTQRFISVFDYLKPSQLEIMTPDELFAMSRSSYKCWCLDSRQELPQRVDNPWTSW